MEGSYRDTTETPDKEQLLLYGSDNHFNKERNSPSWAALVASLLVLILCPLSDFKEKMEHFQ